MTAEDRFGNVATAFSGPVSVGLLNNPIGAAAMLGGTLTATATAGVATFTGLTLNQVASGYTLQATGGGLTLVTTAAISVTPPPASQLVVTAQPQGIGAGAWLRAHRDGRGC